MRLLSLIIVLLLFTNHGIAKTRETRWNSYPPIVITNLHEQEVIKMPNDLHNDTIDGQVVLTFVVSFDNLKIDKIRIDRFKLCNTKTKQELYLYLNTHFDFNVHHYPTIVRKYYVLFQTYIHTLKIKRMNNSPDNKKTTYTIIKYFH
ncbi:hypothetical protein FHX64_002721 [Microbacter margulisiae]|uniref:Uncharacterized protein n=1 Tax=Microbacter margulisiae TaxID=1350067 RepID=A0A7W5H2C1_9PORP|nr:hypothetical protein [Microbacter margulisiae]